MSSSSIPKTCVGGCAVWCRKYFCEGQQLTSAEKMKLAEVNDPDLPLYKRILLRQRRLIAFITPALFVHFFWWGVMIQYSLWHYFPQKYFMTITMIFGSMFAGLTSEGGGAVAFPVMTLGFGIEPSIARDFSMMIQSAGMTCAAITIILMRVQLEWHAIFLCSLGGGGGMIFGLQLIDPLLTSAQKKMFFVSIWFAFASVLLFINRHHKRRTHDTIVDLSLWKGIVLIITGFIGGIFTSFAGSGLDICSFSILTLLFRISEKVATPTSIVLMAGNSLVGFYWRGVMLQAIEQESWEFLTVCVPVVVFGAPFGSLVGTHFHRLVLAGLVITMDLVALVSAYAIVQLSPTLIGVSVAIIVGGVVFFWFLSFLGQKLLARWDTDQAEGATVDVPSSSPVVQSNMHINPVISNTDEMPTPSPIADLPDRCALPTTGNTTQASDNSVPSTTYKSDRNFSSTTHLANREGLALRSLPDVAYIDGEGNTRIGQTLYPRQEAAEQERAGRPDAIDFVTIGGEVYALVKPIVIASNMESSLKCRLVSDSMNPSDVREADTVNSDASNLNITTTEL